ncbi:MAG: DUF4443 domain-containing protein [Candidatus Nezhaarchaeota archaeon]|nr:DUF4443 domain-containing protein [Candidatus Nezhaarchaeota archaeon]
MSSLLEALSKWRGRPGRGPKIEVPLHKLILLLRILDAEGPIGRYSLVSKAGLGEGVVRSMLSTLIRHGFAEAKRGRGCVLSLSGRRELKELLERYGVIDLKPISPPQLNIGAFEVAAHVKGASSKVRMGIEQRDEAIKAGARGALTLVCRKGRLVVPGVEEPLEEVSPSLANCLSGMFKLEDGDVVLVCSSDERWRAEEAAIATAISLASGGSTSSFSYAR